MKKWIKRVLTLMLAIILCFANSSLMAFAAEELPETTLSEKVTMEKVESLSLDDDNFICLPGFENALLDEFI